MEGCPICTSFVLIIISWINLKEQFKTKDLFLLILGFLMMIFFRNNGIFIMIITLPFIICDFWNKNFKVIISLILTFIFYFVVKGPGFEILKVNKTNSVEAFSIPLQQIARVYFKDEEVSKENENYLKEIIDVNIIGENYLPFISDPIKNLTDRYKVSITKKSFFSTWFNLLYNHPVTYIEAYLTQTLGYWYPEIDYWATPGLSLNKELKIKNETNMPAILCKLIDLSSSKKIPLSPIFWNIGIAIFITLYSFVLSLYNKSDYCKVYSLFFGLWLSMMVAAPVYAEYRYMFGIFTCLPIIFLLPFLKKKTIL